MKKQVSSGELNQNIQIMTPADIDDGAGGTYPGEVLYWSTSAKVDILRAQRSLQANQEQLKPTSLFTVRNRNDKFVNVDMVVLWRGERFNIVSAEPDYVYKEWLVITARAIQLPTQ